MNKFTCGRYFSQVIFVCNTKISPRSYNCTGFRYMYMSVIRKTSEQGLYYVQTKHFSDSLYRHDIPSCHGVSSFNISFLCYFIVTSYYSHLRFLVLLVAKLVRHPKGYVLVNLLVKRHKMKQAMVKVHSYQHTLHIFVGMLMLNTCGLAILDMIEVIMSSSMAAEFLV